MPPKKKIIVPKKKIIVPKMLSIRENQYKRLSKIAEKEGRSMRTILERMLDQYEKNNK